MISNYDKFKFVVVENSLDIEEKVGRRNIEKKYAEREQALYWCG